MCNYQLSLLLTTINASGYSPAYESAHIWHPPLSLLLRRVPHTGDRRPMPRRKSTYATAEDGRIAI